MCGISSSTRNAARLRDYDRVVQLARLRMNELLADPRGAAQRAAAKASSTRRSPAAWNAGWRARVTYGGEDRPSPVAGDFALDRIQLEIWWMSGEQRRSFPLESYRRRTPAARGYCRASGRMRHRSTPASP